MERDCQPFCAICCWWVVRRSTDVQYLRKANWNVFRLFINMSGNRKRRGKGEVRSDVFHSSKTNGLKCAKIGTLPRPDIFQIRIWGDLKPHSFRHTIKTKPEPNAENHPSRFVVIHCVKVLPQPLSLSYSLSLDKYCDDADGALLGQSQKVLMRVGCHIRSGEKGKIYGQPPDDVRWVYIPLLHIVYICWCK